MSTYRATKVLPSPICTATLHLTILQKDRSLITLETRYIRYCPPTAHIHTMTWPGSLLKKTVQAQTLSSLARALSHLHWLLHTQARVSIPSKGPGLFAPTRTKPLCFPAACCCWFNLIAQPSPSPPSQNSSPVCFRCCY